MNAAKFWAVFSVGVFAGAAVALICAPQSGTKTRRHLRRGLDDAGDYLKDRVESITGHAEKYVKRGKGIMNDAVDTASSAVKNVVPL